MTTAKGRARPRAQHTMSPETAEYLKKFDNQSKIIDEAIELHRIKDKLVMKPLRGEVIKVID